MDVILTVSSKQILCERMPSLGVSWPQWEYFVLWQMLMTSLQISSRHALLHVLWQAGTCLHRIMHWARRIEQEIDRVFQHITGAQQLKGVSTSLGFVKISLMSVLNQPIKTHQAESRTSAQPWSCRAAQWQCMLPERISVFLNQLTANNTLTIVFLHQIKNKHIHKQLLYELFLAWKIWCWIHILLTACTLFAVTSLSKTDAWIYACTDLKPEFRHRLIRLMAFMILSFDQYYLRDVFFK